jgi:hypothetical protein
MRWLARILSAVLFGLYVIPFFGHTSFGQTTPPRTITLTDPISHAVIIYTFPQNYNLVCVPPSCLVPSPDGTTSQAPNGPSLTTSSSIWSWGTAVPGRPGEYYVNSSPLSASNVGVLMKINNGGKLYVKAANGTWWLASTYTAWSQTTVVP